MPGPRLSEQIASIPSGQALRSTAGRNEWGSLLAPDHNPLSRKDYPKTGVDILYFTIKTIHKTYNAVAYIHRFLQVRKLLLKSNF